jgi:elongation factor G
MKAVSFDLENPEGGMCTIAAAVEGNGVHRDLRQRRYGHVRVEIAPGGGPEFYRFEWRVLEEMLPFPWMKDACLAGVKAALSEPLPSGERVVRVRVSVIDGNYHATDTDEEAMRTAARLAVRNALSNATFIRL